MTTEYKKTLSSSVSVPSEFRGTAGQEWADARPEAPLDAVKEIQEVLSEMGDYLWSMSVRSRKDGPSYKANYQPYDSQAAKMYHDLGHLYHDVMGLVNAPSDVQRVEFSYAAGRVRIRKWVESVMTAANLACRLCKNHHDTPSSDWSNRIASSVSRLREDGIIEGR